MLLFLSCTPPYKIQNVEVITNRSVPAPDNIIFTLDPGIDSDLIAYIEINGQDNRSFKFHSFQFEIVNNRYLYKIRTSDFISDFRNAEEIRSYLTKSKLKLKLEGGKSVIYKCHH